MNILRFARRLVFANIKRNMLYALTVAFATAVIFGVLNLVFQPQYQTDFKIQGASMGFASIVLFLAAMAVLYCNTFFIAEKLKEIAIMTVSGVTVAQLGFTLLFEHAIIFLLSLPIGVPVAFFTSMIINYISNITLNLNFNIMTIRIEAVISTVIILLVNIIYLALLDTSWLFKDKEVLDLLAINGKIAKPDVRVIKIPSITYVILYILPFIIFITNRNDNILSIVMLFTYVGIFGMSGTIKYFLPKLIIKRKRKKYMNNGIRLLALGNYHYAMRSSELLVILISICTTGLASAVCYNQSNAMIGLIAIITYVIVTILLVICIIYKIIVEVIRRFENYRQIQLTGFSQRNVITMIKTEVFYYFTSIILITFPYLYTTLWAHTREGNVLKETAFLLGIFNIIVLILSGFITYISYKNYVLKRLKGGFGNE